MSPPENWVEEIIPDRLGGVYCDEPALLKPLQPPCFAKERRVSLSAPSTSTPAGDPPEIEAIRKVFGTGDKCPPISATKALTGHSLGATGVQEAIYSLLMMNNGFVCESAHIQELDPVFADMPIVRKRIDNAKLGTVLSNSFGFGGTNATLVFKRMDA